MQAPASARWIGPAHPFDLHEAYINFRRDVKLGAKPQAAALAITADSRYRLWINGRHVARGPSRSWPHAQQVDSIDVSAFLRKGANQIAVQIYSPGYSHFAYVHRGTCGLLAWLQCEGGLAAVTDSTWQARRDPSWRADVQRVSIYGSGVERRDLEREVDWLDPDGWGAARVVAPADGPLWRGLAPRDVPMLREEVVKLAAPWRFKRGAALTISDPHEALTAQWSAAQVAEPSLAVSIRSGQVALWAFDLGESCTCNARVHIDGAAGGERLLIGYAEKLRNGDILFSDPATYCRMRLTDEFILRWGGQIAEGFSQRGGRYVVFAIEARRDVTLDLRFEISRTTYPSDVGGVCHSADAVLDRIAQMCQRTLLNCLQDGFVDSVWRESSLWLGDCVPQAFAFASISDDHRPLRRAITMAAAGAYDDCVLPSVLPGEVHAYTIVDYNFSWVELLAMYHGSDCEALLIEMRPVARGMLARFAQDAGPDGLIRSQPGRRFFLDWSPVDRREPNLTYNARYLYALQLAHRLRIGDYGNDIEALRSAITTAFARDGGWHENPFSVPASQLGLAFLILTGFSAQREADAMVSRSLDLDDAATPGKLVLASPFMHHYIFLALDSLGRHDDIMRIIRARWGRWADAGEPTCWENWNVDFPDGSKCHGFSAHPLGWIRRG